MSHNIIILCLLIGHTSNYGPSYCISLFGKWVIIMSIIIMIFKINKLYGERHIPMNALCWPATTTSNCSFYNVQSSSWSQDCSKGIKIILTKTSMADCDILYKNGYAVLFMKLEISRKYICDLWSECPTKQLRIHFRLCLSVLSSQ